MFLWLNVIFNLCFIRVIRFSCVCGLRHDRPAQTLHRQMRYVVSSATSTMSVIVPVFQQQLRARNPIICY